jgi:hypothetical protein
MYLPHASSLPEIQGVVGNRKETYPARAVASRGVLATIRNNEVLTVA